MPKKLHFFPIHGQSKLDKIRDRDIRKQIEAQTIGCSLIVPDISHLKYWKETKAFINREYGKKIKLLIESLDS